LVVYYDFQRRADSPGILHAAADGSSSPLDGVIKDAKWVSGRMHGKQALEFDGAEARVAVQLPKRMTQMTVAAWVTVALIDDRYRSNGLLMSDGWIQPSDMGQWQILRDGRVLFGTAFFPCGNSEPVLTWQTWGSDRWHHLAVVVDAPNRKSVFFLDGKNAGAEMLKFPKGFGVLFGHASIGNWRNDRGEWERGFHGRMDELVILSRAMTDREIEDAYQSGKVTPSAKPAEK
jgi:hypothetical protein